jgi:hypothetical protein
MECSRHPSARERWDGASCCVHVPRAGSTLRRFDASGFGPPPLLHSTRHTAPALMAPPWFSTAVEDSRVSGDAMALWVRLRFLKGIENNRVPRPGMTGVRRSEVKEEGRSRSSRSASALIRPGGHEQRRTHGILGSQRPSRGIRGSQRRKQASRQTSHQTTHASCRHRRARSHTAAQVLLDRVQQELVVGGRFETAAQAHGELDGHRGQTPQRPALAEIG